MRRVFEVLTFEISSSTSRPLKSSSTKHIPICANALYRQQNSEKINYICANRICLVDEDFNGLDVELDILEGQHLKDSSHELGAV